MRKYEGMFIINSNTDEERRNSIMDRLKGIIEENGAITNIDEWGNRKLAYEINDLREGHYTVLKFEAERDVITELDRICKITEEVIRHMIVREDEK